VKERYPDGSLSHLYDFASNHEETRLGMSVPIPTPDEVFLDAEETMRFVQVLEAPPRPPTPALANAAQLYRQTVKELQPPLKSSVSGRIAQT
jgi:hypothetical protein